MSQHPPHTTSRRGIAYFAAPALALTLALSGCSDDSTNDAVVEPEPAVERGEAETDAPDAPPENEPADPAPETEPEDVPGAAPEDVPGAEDVPDGPQAVMLPDYFPDDIPLWSGTLSLAEHVDLGEAEYWRISIYAPDGEADLQSARELLITSGFEELSWSDDQGAPTRGTLKNDRHNVDLGMQSAPDGLYIQYWVETEF